MNVALHGQCAASIARAHDALVDSDLSTALALAAAGDSRRYARSVPRRVRDGAGIKLGQLAGGLLDDSPTVPCPALEKQAKRARKSANKRARFARVFAKVVNILVAAPKTMPCPPPFLPDGECCRGKFFHEGSCPHYTCLGTWRDRVMP